MNLRSTTKDRTQNYYSELGQKPIGPGKELNSIISQMYIVLFFYLNYLYGYRLVIFFVFFLKAVMIIET